MADPEQHPAHAEEYEVEIVPETLVPAHDPDGLPRTDPPAEAKKVAPEPKKGEQEQLVKALKEERDQRIAEANREREARQAAIQIAAQERLARQQAEAARAEAEQDAEKFTGIASRAHMGMLHTRHEHYKANASNAKQMIASIKRDMVAASENADHARMAELQEQMAKATSLEMNYLNAAGEYEERIRDAEARLRAQPEPKPQPQPKPQQPQQRQDPIDRPPQQAPATPEQWIEAVKPRVGEKGAEWLRAHTEYITDPEKHEQLRQFTQYYALRKGGAAALKTESFIAALNNEFFPEDNVADEEETISVETEERKPAPVQRTPAAPVTRGAPAKSSSQSANKIELTPQEHALAPEMWGEKDWELFHPSVREKFKQWSPTAARWQYHHAKLRGQAEGKFRG